MIPVLPVAVGLGLALLVGRRRGAADTGSGAEGDPGSSQLGLPVAAALAPALQASLFGDWLYYWGGPSPMNPAGLVYGVPFAGPVRGDCSGAARALLISAGLAPLTLERFTSASLPSSPSFVAVASPEPGDLLLYDGHVTVCVGGSGDGCTVWSMSGGGPSTKGDNPNAKPKLFSGARYRKDYRGAYRLRR